MNVTLGFGIVENGRLFCLPSIWQWSTILHNPKPRRPSGRTLMRCSSTTLRAVPQPRLTRCVPFTQDEQAAFSWLWAAPDTSNNHENMQSSDSMKGWAASPIGSAKKPDYTGGSPFDRTASPLREPWAEDTHKRLFSGVLENEISRPIARAASTPPQRLQLMRDDSDPLDIVNALHNMELQVLVDFNLESCSSPSNAKPVHYPRGTELCFRLSSLHGQSRPWYFSFIQMTFSTIRHAAVHMKTRILILLTALLAHKGGSLARWQLLPAFNDMARRLVLLSTSRKNVTSYKTLP